MPFAPWESRRRVAVNASAREAIVAALGGAKAVKRIPTVCLHYPPDSMDSELESVPTHITSVPLELFAQKSSSILQGLDATGRAFVAVCAKKRTSGQMSVGILAQCYRETTLDSGIFEGSIVGQYWYVQGIFTGSSHAAVFHVDVPSGRPKFLAKLRALVQGQDPEWELAVPNQDPTSSSFVMESSTFATESSTSVSRKRSTRKPT